MSAPPDSVCASLEESKPEVELVLGKRVLSEGIHQTESPRPHLRAEAWSI